MNITLPWPPSGLSPNARNHWAKLAKLKKQYRETCAWAAMSQGVRPIKAEQVKVHLAFVPPNRRRRDWDNLLASMKSGLDGLSDVLRVDDSRFVLSFEIVAEVGGFVRVEVQA